MRHSMRRLGPDPTTRNPAVRLSFAHAIPEKLGLALAAAIEADPTFVRRLKDSLRKAAPEDAGTERRVLERALKGGGTQSGRAAPLLTAVIQQRGLGTSADRTRRQACAPETQRRAPRRASTPRLSNKLPP